MRLWIDKLLHCLGLFLWELALIKLDDQHFWPTGATDLLSNVADSYSSNIHKSNAQQLDALEELQCVAQWAILQVFDQTSSEEFVTLYAPLVSFDEMSIQS